MLGIVPNLGNTKMNEDVVFFPQIVHSPMRKTDKQFTITMLHDKIIKGEREKSTTRKKRDT